MNFFPNIPKTIVPILFINFISTLSFSIVLPFLFVLVEDYGGNAFIYGILGATYSVFQLIGSPILGSWSDRFGRKPILLLSQFGTLLSWIIFLLAFFLDSSSTFLDIFSLSFPLLAIFFARALDGITGGNVSVANAYLADISTKETRTRNFGLMSVSASLGFVIGPALAGLLGNTSVGLLLPVSIAVFISVIGLMLIVFSMKPEVKIPDISSEREETQVKKTPFKEILKIPHLKLILLMNFIIFLGFNFFYVSFPVYIIEEIGTALELGFLLTFLSLCMVIVQGPILSKVSNKTSTNNLMIIGSVLLAFGFVTIILREQFFLYSSMILIALGNGLLYPSLVATLSNHAGDKFQGATQGYAASSGSLASIIGLVIGGVLYQVLKSGLFIFSALTILLLVIMTFRLRFVERTHEIESKCAYTMVKSSQPIIDKCDPFSVPKYVRQDKIKDGIIS